MSKLESNQLTPKPLSLGKPSTDCLSANRAIKATHPKSNAMPTAVVYCEGNFGKLDGKTANGLVRHSENYQVIAVIDSEQAGLDAGMVLDNKHNGIPIVSSLDDVMTMTETLADFFIFGLAPSAGMLPTKERTLILYAISLKMNIVNGLHEFFNDDAELLQASIFNNVKMLDVRKPKDKKDLHVFDGSIHDVACPRIAVLGTDCAIGKRTTATKLTEVLKAQGLNVVMIATGQTGIIQGAPYGVALDAVPSQFCAGELEAIIVKAYKTEKPDVIIIEGQGALSHPAFSTSAFILRGSCPTGVILQHAPTRKFRTDFINMPMPTVSSEIELIELFAKTSVMGVTLNHEGMSADETVSAIKRYTSELKLPVTDALTQPTQYLLDMVLSAFPELEEKVLAPLS